MGGGVHEYILALTVGGGRPTVASNLGPRVAPSPASAQRRLVADGGERITRAPLGDSDGAKTIFDLCGVTDSIECRPPQGRAHKSCKLSLFQIDNRKAALVEFVIVHEYDRPRTVRLE